MQKIISTIIIIVFGSLAIGMSAQDYHLSHYDAAQIYLNPATTGVYYGQKANYRVSADFRSQWGALGVKPFTTAFLSYDQPIKKWRKKFGVGGYLLSNKSGVANFQTMTAMASGSYDIMNGTREHYLTAGLQLGVFYRSFNTSLTYDSQYSEASGSFDSSMPTNETFNQANMIRFDGNVGVRYVFKPMKKNYRPYGGVSLYHVTFPKESVTGKVSRMPMRVSVNGGCDLNLSNEFELQPRFLYMRQRSAHEFNIGTLLYYRIKKADIDPMFGIDYRVKDAAIIHVGLRQGLSIFRFSYDVNTSYLNNYTSGRGAWEFSVIYSPKKKR